MKNIIAIVACLLAASLVCATNGPVEPMQSNVENDGSAVIHMSQHQVETCERGDGCVIITNRQLKTIIELIKGKRVGV